MKFHVHDMVYIKPIGLVSSVSRIVLIRDQDKELDILCYMLGDELQNMNVHEDELELVEPGPFRKASEEFVKRKKGMI